MIMNLRGDIEKVRMLSEQVQKREKQKLERVRKQMAYIETIIYPVEYIIRPILEHLIEYVYIYYRVIKKGQVLTSWCH
jgi:hypothetical protein